MSSEIIELAKHDATVNYAVTMCQVGHITYTEMLEGLALALAQEKKTYFDRAVMRANLEMQPPQVVVMPGGTKLI